MSQINFTHLHLHTEYSLLDGAVRIKKVIEAASQMGMKSLAITDHGVMYGIIKFYKEAKKAGIKPIIGCEVYQAFRTRFDRESHRDAGQNHLVLLAKNITGYRNLMRLVTAGYSEGFYYKPRIDYELLEQYHEGLIALSGCLAGEIPRAILSGRVDKAAEAARRLHNIFGEGNFYLEIQDHRIPEQKTVNKAIAEISRREGIPLVATNDVHYLKKEDAAVHDVLLCIQTGKTVADPNRLKFATDEFYFKSPEEMAALFPEYPDAIENTMVIADACNVEFDFSQTHLPDFTIPDTEKSGEEYLRHLCELGLKKYYQQITEEIQNRLDYELSVISQMGYTNYFLIVWDFIRFARENQIPVGPGRGSAAGSLVAYTLGITAIDPLRYSLLFERFLNPERVNMPDIDIDFCYEKREKVIEYVSDKYGEDRVAQIITFGTMAARAAVRDVGRALNFSYAETDRIAKMIPADIGMTIEKALKQNPALLKVYREDARVEELINISLQVEGMPRHASVHAAGVVIGGAPLVDFVPLQRTADGGMVTQFPMTTLEELGLLKMDFLGLRTLTMMEEAGNNIQLMGKEPVDWRYVPLEDEKTYNMLSRGDTLGVFQLESSGMRSVLRELCPNRIEDVIAVVALYRPGPMEQIPTFISNKHGDTKIHYLHNDLVPILKETYGIMVYQEQIMQVASAMAGFSLGQADLLRRAIGKKKKEVLDQQREVFVNGCVNNGHSNSLGNELYDLIVKFASYGFNKSHAAAYAVVAYQTAYLKANYPLEFMASLLTSVMSNSDKISLYINDCRQHEIEVLPPDINESRENFTPVAGNRIRFGLSAVKNVGHAAVDSIVSCREAGENFNSLSDFCMRVDLRACNKKTIESLIKSGAFDSMGASRAQLLAVMEDTVMHCQNRRRLKENGIQTVLDFMGGEEAAAEINEDKFPAIPEVPRDELLKMEKDNLGLYISGHPLENYSHFFERLSIMSVLELSEGEHKQQVQIAGMVTSIKSFVSKKGNPMAFMQVEDLTGVVEVVVFPDAYGRCRDLLAKERLAVIEGSLDYPGEEGEVKILAERVIVFPQQIKELYLHVNTGISQQRLLELQRLLSAEAKDGNIPVYLVFPNKDKMLLTPAGMWIKEDEAILQRLSVFLGKNNVQVKIVED